MMRKTLASLLCLSLTAVSIAAATGPAPRQPARRADGVSKGSAPALPGSAASVPAPGACCSGAGDVGPASAGTEPAHATEGEGIFRQFDDWARCYRSARSVEEKALLEGAGRALAEVRRGALKERIARDPERALASAFPDRLRAGLPASILDRLETRVSGRGDLQAIAFLPDFAPEAGSEGRRQVRLGGSSYRAFVYGRRLDQPSMRDIPLHGIVLDGSMAVHASPVRVLGPDDLPSPSSVPAEPAGACPVSGRPADPATAVRVEAGDRLYALCEGGHAAALERSYLAEETAGAQSGPLQPLDPAWTTGTKRILYYRLCFLDDPSDPQSYDTAASQMAAAGAWYAAGSFGATTWETTVTPLLALPGSRADYEAGGGGIDANLARDHARAAALTAGYDWQEHDLEVFRVSWPERSWAVVGGRESWIHSSGMGVICHEIGHNYGLHHANLWDTSRVSAIGPGTDYEYGNRFDVMGEVLNPAHHFNAYEKAYLGWIPAGQWHEPAASGTYRIHAMDQGAISPGLLYGIRIYRDPERDYWLGFRQDPAANSFLMSGLELLWDPWSRSMNGSELLDTTPGTGIYPYQDAEDAPLVIGRTFSDVLSGVHVTPVAKGGTSPESMDVVVNLGTFPSNQPPSLLLSADATSVAPGAPVQLTASASDPDGDVLAYAWTFGDGTFGTASVPSVSRSWSAAGEHVVRCVATDMKGGTASASLVIRVGNPATFRIGGRVVSAFDGSPVAEVLVKGMMWDMMEGAWRLFETCTDSDGTYALAGLPVGDYTLTAARYGWSISASGFANPVVVGPSAAGIDFAATAVGMHSISGRVTSAGSPVEGVLVCAGFQTVLTDASGSWSMQGVPDGSYAMTAKKEGTTYPPSGWSNPLVVGGADRTGIDFKETLYQISGEVAGVEAPVTVSDGVRTTFTQKKGGVWKYTLTNVPKGTYTLTATLAGYAIAPSSFANPVVVTGGNLSGRSFAVYTPVLTTIAVAPSSVTLGPGGDQQFSAAAFDQEGFPMPATFAWTATGGTVAQDGLYIAPATPGAYAVSAASGGISGSASVVVNAPAPVLTAIVVSPGSITLGPGGRQQLAATALDQDGNPMPATFSWSATGGTITSGGLYTAPTAYGGPHTVTASSGGVSGLAIVAMAAPVLKTLALSPASVSLNYGQQQQFAASATDQYGAPVSAVLAWSATKGTITSTGLYTAPRSGSGATVTASSGGVSGSAKVALPGGGGGGPKIFPE